MRVLVSGSTGLIGSALVRRLDESGHLVTRLVRGVAPDHLSAIRWDPANGHLDDGALDGIDAVIHLAGEGIAAKRWTKKQKAKIFDSRVAGTRLLAAAAASATKPPAVFLSASAIGFYGSRGDDRLDESSPAGSGFASEVSVAWEAATDPIDHSSTRVVFLRTGIVLSAAGGALAEQVPFFRLGLGGRIGSGRQWLSWIGIDDEVEAILWLLSHPLQGPVNLVAPNPVTNAEFAKTLGAVLHRPAVLPTPLPALWARMGRELTRDLLLASTHVAPNALHESGFEFSQPHLDGALRSIL